MDDLDNPATLPLAILQRIHKDHLLILIVSALAGLAVTRLLPAFPRKQPSSSSSSSSVATKSNLDDEFTYSTTGGDGPCRIKALYIYPIKSCGGISLSSASVVSTGLKHDREFTFAELHSDGGWRFITQRKHPLLTQVQTSIVADKLVVSFPASWWGRNEFSVSLEHEEGEELLPVTVWSDSPDAWKLPIDLQRLRRFLGVKGELALFRVCERREVFRCAPRKETLGWQPVTGFADSFPISIMNISSVRDLNARIVDKIPQLSVLRFRPNIILEGLPTFSEDAWKRFRIGHNEFFAACRTTRCKLPNVNPITGEKHPQEPDQTMRKYRNIDAGAKNKACLGMQVVPARHGDGVAMSVGDEVVVTETGEHFFME
ncbi:hypothetical protein K440DRAFT_562141 [Wilcoxina mikolae CBS 423.85]|nr:hypothetical protein K440DRAFT_562141 [Wilcoxina mikolae CBS 423.85]